MGSRQGLSLSCSMPTPLISLPRFSRSWFLTFPPVFFSIVSHRCYTAGSCRRLSRAPTPSPPRPSAACARCAYLAFVVLYSWLKCGSSSNVPRAFLGSYVLFLRDGLSETGLRRLRPVLQTCHVCLAPTSCACQNRPQVVLCGCEGAELGKCDKEPHEEHRNLYVSAFNFPA